MLELLLTNVRAFAGPHTIPVAPLTLITGENSSGKSTVLAALSAVLDPALFPLRPPLNEAPYSLGSYDTIATYKGGKFGRAKSFSIGFHRAEGDKHDRYVLATYSEKAGQPALSQLHARGPEGELLLDVSQSPEEGFRGHLTIRVEGEEQKQPFALPSLPTEGRAVGLGDLFVSLAFAARRHSGQTDPSFLNRVLALGRHLSPGGGVSIAPIRTKPERVYGQPAASFEPDGNHIPFVLDRLLREPATRQTKAVIAALGRFGLDSELFERIKVRKLGQKVGEPFQIMVSVGGKWRNLIDVGYGVSQALPVLVQSTLVSPGDWLLVQQPEVHLHPRAQAALGSLFASLVQQSRKRLVVETHSDYVIDRVRREIAEGRISKDKVCILFLRRRKLETSVFPVELDDRGNVESAPPSYRDFFIREQLQMLEHTSD